MKHTEQGFGLRVIAIAVAVASGFLASCGGSGGGGGASGLPLSGTVTDGYVSGAVVTLDVNDDRICAVGEPTTVTNGAGQFSFTAAQNSGGGQHMTCASGGVDIITGQQFFGQLLAPPGATQITPLTNLVMAQVNATLPLPALGVSSPVSPSSVATASTNLMNSLGIAALPAGQTLITADPVVLAASNPTLLQATAAVQVLLQKTAEAVAAAAGVSSQAGQLYQKAAGSLAAILTVPAASPNAALTAGVIKAVVSGTVSNSSQAAGLAPASVAAFVAPAVTPLVSAIAGATNLTTVSDANPATVGQSNVVVVNSVGMVATLLTDEVAAANTGAAGSALLENLGALSNTMQTQLNSVGAGNTTAADAATAISAAIVSATTTGVTVPEGSLPPPVTPETVGGGVSTTSTTSTTTTSTTSSTTSSTSTTSTTVTTTTTTTLVPQTDLQQAKAMFADLRSTFNFYTNNAHTGFLDVQRQRITNDLTNTVAPSLGLTADRVVLMANGMQMAVDITGSVVATAIAGLPASPVYLTQKNLQLRQDGSGNYYFWRQVSASSGDNTVSCTSNAFSQSAWTTAASSGTVPSGFHVQCDGRPSTGVVGGTNFARFHTIIERTGNFSFNYKAWRTLVATEAVDGRSGTAPNYTYAYTGTGAVQVGDIFNPNTLISAAINGSLPTSQEGAARDSLSANVALSQSGNVNTLNVTGTLASVNGSGVALSTFTLAQGSQVLGAVNTGLVTGITFVGEAKTADTRFNGTLTAGSFQKDASNTHLMPTNVSFNGTITDTSSGGTAPFLSGTLELTVGNQSNFDATQPNSQSNFRTFTATFNGNVTAPAHPVTTLVFNGSQHTGTNLTSATLTFTHGNINITGSVSQNVSNVQTLSLTNQNGIQIVWNGDGYTVSKSGVTLATITNAGIITYSDSTSESLL